jgi:general secretion pathway protein D
MDIQQQVQQVGGSVVIDGNSVPVTQDQNASAKVAVRDKETIVLGGFIRDELSEGKSGIPFLKDIPLLGYIFRSTSKTTARRELLVMIRPTVLPTPGDAAIHAGEMRKDMPSLRMTERQIQDVENKLQKKADLEEREAAKAKSTKSK